MDGRVTAAVGAAGWVLGKVRVVGDVVVPVCLYGKSSRGSFAGAGPSRNCPILPNAACEFVEKIVISVK